MAYYNVKYIYFKYHFNYLYCNYFTTLLDITHTRAHTLATLVVSSLIITHQ